MSEQTTIPYKPAIEKKRIEESVTCEIHRSPDQIFPLACPVEELRWIPNWEYNLVYSKSGVNETNCIFIEQQSGPLFFEKPLPTTWVTNVYDPVRNRILFHLNISDKAFIRLQFRIWEVGKDVSRCNWKMVYTALDEEANAMQDDEIRSKLLLIMNFLSDALKHYCETGGMLA